MYPTNYMNPMNNQPMSPDYGYNRMQQVQQMQQAINPTVPNMRVYPIIFGNDPNHFSLLCCVPNTVYTPPVIVPTEG